MVLEKVAAPFGEQQFAKLRGAVQKDKRAKNLVVGGAAAGGALAGVGLALLSRRGVRTHTVNALRPLVGLSGGRAKEVAAPIPKEVQRQAKALVRHLRRQGVDPKKARIAISGTGGTGKSTLARAISEQAGLRHFNMDLVGSATSKGGHERFLRKNRIPRGSVLDQTHLLTQANPDRFDAIVHIERPIPVIKKGLLKRKRGAYQRELFDYDSLHKDITTAFETTRGKPAVVADLRDVGGARVRVKTRPRSGFKADRELDTRLIAAGIDPKGMSRARKVQSLARGHRSRGPFTGPFKYWKKEPMVTTGLLGGAGGGAAAVAADRVLDPTPRTKV